MVDRWRVTLMKVGNLSGYHVHEKMSQVAIIDEIVDRILLEINPVTLDVAKYPVGLDTRVKDITALLSNDTKCVNRIGIHGMGGVGKTTLAKAVYNQNYHRFQGGCFLANVKDVLETRKGLICLQQKLISDVLKCKNITIDNVDQGIEVIRARICSTKILIVIDDLDNSAPLEYLEGPFAFGSAIIITTRYEDLLDSIEVEAKYKVKELGDADSRRLFIQHAFADNNISDTFMELSKEILEHAGGLPLALKVCGSNLLNQSEEGWRWFIDKLRRVSLDDVEKKLLISFDALKLVDPMLQDIFLDIACFFIGDKAKEVVQIMETCYTFSNRNIDILKKRDLLSINDRDELEMHDLLRDMGRKISCNNSPDEPGKHSRLWVTEDIYDLLKNDKGTEAVEGIIFGTGTLVNNLPPDIFSHHRAIFDHFTTDTFQRMSKLKFLHLEYVKLTGSFEHSFKDLRWLHWKFCPLKCLPSDFYLQRLVMLELPHSKLTTIWKINRSFLQIPHVFENLKTLNMSHSLDLITTSDLTRLPYLETLNLEGCESLKELHISIGSLVRLVSLNLQFCVKLKSLPDSICNLTALKCLNIARCSSLKALPTNLGNIGSLEELNAKWLTINKLPHSIGLLGNLIELKLCFCGNLETLPDTICNLRTLKILYIDGSCRLKALPEELGNLESLVELKAENLIVSKLPDSIGRLSKLIELNLSCCSKLESLPETVCNLRSLKILDIGWCSSVKALPTELGNLESLIELKAMRLTVPKLPDSIGRLSKLVKLNLSVSEKLKTLPDSICNLRSLKILDIDDCHMLEALPTELGNLESLVGFKAERIKVLKLPDSIGHIRSLENIWLKGCFNLLSIAELPSNLKLLSLEGCNSMETLPNLSNMKQLEELNLTGCSVLTEIQGLEDLSSIKTLHLGGCDSSMLADTFTKHFFQIYSGFGHHIKIYASTSVFPDWICQSSDWIGKTISFGSKVSLDLPPNMSHNFLALILCSRFSRDGEAYYSVKTTTNDFVWRQGVPSLRYFYDHYDDYNRVPCMDVVPRKVFSVTDSDYRIIFKARQKYYESCGDNVTLLTQAAEILGLYLLYKPEITVFNECNRTTIDVDEEGRHSSKRLKHL
ncbi:disease resistance protein RPV1-like isoform X1 [Daucus carota subsp. sativus]